MLKLFILTVCCVSLTCAQSALAECSGSEIAKMLDKGYSKQEVDKICSGSGTSGSKSHTSSSESSRTCKYTSGPKAGRIQYFGPQTYPVVNPARVGDPCTDGLGSSGVAIADEEEPKASAAPVSVLPQYAVEKVFYGTDRNDTKASSPAARFGTERGSATYGVCEVSIPRDHRMGRLEAPSILRLEFREDPSRHVVLLSVTPQKATEFFVNLATRVSEARNREAFVFIHGFNVTFEDAARRTAQMAYDLSFDGAPIFYSWPSQGALVSYPADETNVQWSVPHLQAFLSEVALRSGAKTIHLIAHSMGNRALTESLLRLTADNRSKGKSMFREIVLTAPDIDAEIFKSDIFPRLGFKGAHVTLYASSRDEALRVSKNFHEYPRAGDSGEGLVVLKGLDTVDATTVDTSLIGHSYYAENRSVISDLFYLLRDGTPPNQRFGLQAVSTPQGTYWRFKE
jgi:esterase/lipase superfamily enzyme